MSYTIDLLSTKNLALVAATVSAAYIQPLFERIPMRTSSLSGAAYLDEVLLNENPPLWCPRIDVLLCLKKRVRL